MTKAIAIHQQHQQLAEEIVAKAKQKGATQAQVSINGHQGLDLTVRLADVETIEYLNDKGVGITVYFDQKKGQGSTTDMSPHAIDEALTKACTIAKHTQADEYAGLAKAELMAKDYPQLDIYHPWHVDVDEATALGIQCEQKARQQDPRITNSEGVNISRSDSFFAYANSHGFSGSYQYSTASVYCSLVAEQDGKMQRDYEYTRAIDAKDLLDFDQLAMAAAQKTLARLGARQIKTCEAPVIFTPLVARGLWNHLLSAISGSSLYRHASFLLNSLNTSVTAPHITLVEDPFLPKGFGSTPFDLEGVSLAKRTLIDGGVLQGYVLNSYAARKLGMESTGNAGGTHNIMVSHQDLNFDELLKTMGRGLVVTELMGQGINLVTGDYSRGASGYWVEQGEIQFPVEEITIAGNLKNMFKQIVAISNDVDKRHRLATGSVLIEKMSIAGQ